eukprot:TRINITY_DN3132_c0_g1_i1.p1 TRINITY_DN3132_c0_g1~~TRINITY_DN3132_c0_g1_i1.p1  ORF type:complete len:1081 (+),score=115.60 TRINITY_DN3132_c0_g1_i1:6228-9470(+)
MHNQVLECGVQQQPPTMFLTLRKKLNSNSNWTIQATILLIIKVNMSSEREAKDEAQTLVNDFIHLAKLLLLQGFCAKAGMECSNAFASALVIHRTKFSLSTAFTLATRSPEGTAALLHNLNELAEEDEVLSFAELLEDWENIVVAKEILVAANHVKDTEVCQRVLEKVVAFDEDMWYLAIDTALKSLRSEQAITFYKTFRTSAGQSPIITQLMVRGLSKLQLATSAFSCFDELRTSGTAMNAETTLALLECCVKQGNVEQATEAFEYQKQFSETLDPQCYSIFLKGLCKANYLENALALFAEMQQRFPPKECPYCVLIEGCARCSRLTKALALLEEAKGLKVPLTTGAYNVLIEGCIRSGELSKAWDLLDDMKRNGIDPDSYTYSSIFRGIKENQKDVLKALDLVESLEKDPEFCADAISYNVLLDACVSTHMLSHALELLERMEALESRVKPDEISYNTLIKGCGQMRDYVKAFALFERMQKNRISPNEVTYNSLIDVCVKSGRIESAWELLSAMEAAGLTPDNFTYSTLIKGIHPRNNKAATYNLNKAFDLLNEMKAKNRIKPDEILYNCLMDACVRFKDKYRAVSVFSEMSLAGVPPSAITYGILIKAYGQAGELENAFNAFQSMKTAGHFPNAVTYGCLIDACIKNNFVGKAQDVYETMLRDRVKPNTIIYTTLIKGFAKTKDLKAAMEIYQKMVMDPSSLPNNVTYNSLLDCCAKCDDLSMLETVFEEMKKNGIKADLITFSTMIKGYCRRGKLSNALCLLETMEKQGIQADEVLFNSLLDGCAKKGEIEISLGVVAKMHKAGLELSNISYSILVKTYMRSKVGAKGIMKMGGLEAITDLMKALLKGNYVKEAIDIFDKVENENARFESDMYKELIKGCMATKKWDKATTIALRALNQNPGYARGEPLYKEIAEKTAEKGNIEAKMVLDLIKVGGSTKYLPEGENKKPMFRKIRDSENRFMGKIGEGMKKLGNENINTRNIGQKPVSNNKFAAFIEKAEEAKVTPMKKQEEKAGKAFVAKPISFEAGTFNFRNSKKADHSTQGKIPRLVQERLFLVSVSLLPHYNQNMLLCCVQM